MFNVGIGAIFVILLVCLVVFGPERLQMARQTGRLIGRLHLMIQDALDQLKQQPGRS
jgi:Sec-independent protein translocase protein TatA